MIRTKFVFPNVRRPDDESGRIYSPTLVIDLSAKPCKDELVVLDTDLVLSMNTPGLETKIERFGDVFNDNRGFIVESVVNVLTLNKAQSAKVYLKSNLPPQ